MSGPIDDPVEQAKLADEVSKYAQATNPESWRPLPYEPLYCDYHPCIHRWFKTHNEPRPPRHPRYRYRELSERNVWLAHPLVRRLLWLWICHANTLSPDRRAKLKAVLISYGYTDEELERYLLEQLKRKEKKDAADDDGTKVGKVKRKKGKAKVKKKGKGKSKKKGKGKGKKKKGKGKGKKKKGKSTRANEAKESSKSKKRKPKETKKKGSGKKKRAGVEPKADTKGKSGKGKIGPPGKGWPHSIGMLLFQWAWTNLLATPDEVFLSRAREYFDVQARLLLNICTEAMNKPTAHDTSGCPIEQKMAIMCLNLVVCIAKNVTAPAHDINNLDVENFLKLRGAIPKSSSKKIDKKRKGAKAKDIPVEVKSTEDSSKKGWAETSLPLSSVRQQSLAENSIDRFKNQLIWYSPSEPEFIYNGPREFPAKMQIMEDSESAVWCIENYGIEPENIIPEPVPPFFENIRPCVYSYSNDEKDEDKPQPWYIMSDEKYFEPGPRIADTAPIIEITDMFFNMMGKTISIPNLSMTALLEMLTEMTVAASSVVENVSLEDKLIDNKRTIILERLYVDFFGSKFRDYNDQTSDLMHTLCHRVAVMIRHVYRYTAFTLWTLQSMDRSKFHRKESSEVPPDDPAVLEAWNEWFAWILKICFTGKEWAIWLEGCEGELMDLAELTKQKPFNKWISRAKGEAEDWYDWLDEVHEMAKYFVDNVNNMQQINNRPLPDGFINEKRYPEGGRVSSMTTTSDWMSTQLDYTVPARSRGPTKMSRSQK